MGFGIKGGARLTDFTSDLSSSSFSSTKQDHIYTLGPYAELHLPLGFSIEGDLLFKKSGATLISQPGGTALPVLLRQFNIDSFDLPLLLKYRFGKKLPLHPFAAAGLANRYSTGIPGTVLGASATSGWQEGIVLAGGADVKVLVLKISGELRVTHFGNISASTIPKLNANQAELLLGIGF
jgi:hypothetical protein